MENKLERKLSFEQWWQSGHQCQSGFTHMNSLGATIAGEAFPHLYHFELPDSHWENAKLAVSGSFKALLDGLQASV